MNPILNISCDHKSERLDYVLDFVFKEVLNINYSLIHEEDSDALRHICYSEKKSEGIHVVPHPLLLEKDIREQRIEWMEYKNLPALFATHGEIPFDLFSGIFYLISRYEEYLPHAKDTFKRFPHHASIAYQKNFLHLPLVDQWIEELRKQLNTAYGFCIEKPDFKFIPTYDIDIAYSYLGKGILRTIGGMMKDLFKGKFNDITYRWEVLTGRKEDPYDAYRFLNEIHDLYQLEPIYFFLLSDGGPFNKNLHPENPTQKKLISSIKKRYKTGIHPSYNSQFSEPIIRKEIERMDGTENSRQHYIQFTLPETFRLLLHKGIRHEYSMGYGSINGFRASTAHSFLWFDLVENRKTELRLHPFCYMECNSRFEQKQDAVESYQELIHYKTMIQNQGGQMISIFHNFSLGTDPFWKGWKEIYVEFLRSL